MKIKNFAKALVVMLLVTFFSNFLYQDVLAENKRLAIALAKQEEQVSLTRKRLIKSPKLYFIDVGLACALIGITEAQQLDPESVMGDSIGIKVETADFGRIAAQSAKQIIIQWDVSIPNYGLHNVFVDRVANLEHLLIESPGFFWDFDFIHNRQDYCH